MLQKSRVNFAVLLISLLGCDLGGPPAMATELGIRMSALHDDVPLQAAGLMARWPLKNGYFVEANLDRLSFGQAQQVRAGGIDRMQSTVFGAAIGRAYDTGSFLQHWFWSSGLSAAYPSHVAHAVADKQVVLHAATEIHVTAAVGVSRWLARHWRLQGMIRVEHHFIDWRVSDSADRILLRQRSRSVSGLALTVSYRF